MTKNKEKRKVKSGTTHGAIIGRSEERRQGGETAITCGQVKKRVTNNSIEVSTVNLF